MVDDYKNQAIRIYILNPLLRLKKYDNDFGIISLSSLIIQYIKL